jgi:hypothetical protein
VSLTTVGNGYQRGITIFQQSSVARENTWVVIALCAISMSTLLVEVVVTKFLSIKVDYHYAYAILGMVVLSFGAAGAYIYMRGGVLGTNSSKAWELTSLAAALYALALPLTVALFCWIPIHPFPTSAADSAFVCLAALPLYFMILSIPFFFAGVCISHTLSASRLPVTLIYFWDLLAAAAGAFMCPFLLQLVGGYAVMSIASVLGLGSAVAFQYVSGKRPRLTTVIPCLCAIVFSAALPAYQSWAQGAYGYDVRSTKDPTMIARMDQIFGGVAATHWNAVNRIDISKTASSNDAFYLYGLSPKGDYPTLRGRYILNDAGAPTRQFCVNGALSDQHFLSKTLWASPYIAYGAKPGRTLIIGGGGGIDILIAKYFKTPDVDVVEINPTTYRLLKGEIDDPENAYYPWLASDAQTQITIFNKEARHYTSTCSAQKYDIVQASGVDTYSAVVTGGLALTENYLYTSDAIADYARLLKPGGILSLTHWRLDPPAQSLRIVVTYLDYLEHQGVKEPWKQIVVIGGVNWNDTIMKTTPFTQEEMQAIRKWSADTAETLVYDPLANSSPTVDLRPSEKIYFEIAHSNPSQRLQILAGYPHEVVPVTDDKPYFYNSQKISSWMTLSLEMLLGTAIVLAAVLIFLPLVKACKSGLRFELLPYILFFALCGFAFFLFETATIQLFTVLVGGPLYALSLVLVCVLGGYALGSFIAQYIKPLPRNFLIIGGIIFIIFAALYAGIHPLNKMLMAFDLNIRCLGCGIITLLSSIATGIPVSLAMNRLREQHGNIVAWMWGVSSAFNALGAAAFVPISQNFGISFILLLVATLYGSAAIMLAIALRMDRSQVQSGDETATAIAAD